MADTNSTVQFKADISQLKAAMQQASRQVRLASSEFKAATAGLDDWSSSATGLNAKVKQLNSTLAAQKKQVELANEAYEKTVKVYGENSAEADRAKMSLNNYEAAVAKTEKELNEYSEELKKAEKYGDDYADTLDQMEDAQQRASDGFTVMKGALASLVADGIRMTIGALKDLAKETIQVGMDFESAMSQVGAVSGASAEDMEKLNAKAKEMGSTTKFTATESAEAFNYMAMAGWKTEDMLNGIEGIMNLAAASGADLATTSDIVTDALTAMGYGAEDAGRLADVMAAAASNANTNVEMMGQTFQYAAPIVGALGYDMEDTAVAIGLMANAGIKGEKSGTALRSILTRLSAPPKECAEAMEELGVSLTDSEGNMKSLDDVMKDLRKGFDGLSETQQTQYAKAIAGQEAMSGLLAIVNAAPEDFEKLTKAVEDSNGAAQNMADVMQDNVGGQLTLLKSKVEGIMINLFERASDSMKEGINKISDALDKVDWDAVGDKIAKFATKAIDLFTYLITNGPRILSTLKTIGTIIATLFVVNKVATFAGVLNGLIAKYTTFKAVLDAVKGSQLALNLAQLASPVGLVLAGVTALAGALVYLNLRNKDVQESTSALTEAEQEHIDKVHETAQAYADLKSARDDNVAGIQAEYNHISDLASELDSLADANGAVKEADQDRANFIISTLNEALGTEIEMIDGVIQNYQEEKKAIEDLIETKKAQAILNANEEAYTDAIKNQKQVLGEYVAIQNDYKQKVDELNSATAERQRLQDLGASGYAAEIGMLGDMGYATQMYQDALESATQKEKAQKAAVGELRQALGEAEQNYVNYQTTIKNYEGLSSAIISGDAQKIKDALQNQLNDFITAETGTKETLERQVEAMRNNYNELRQAVENGSPEVTQAMVDEAQGMVNAAVDELNKFEVQAGTSGVKGGNSFVEGVASNTTASLEAAKGVRLSAESGLEPSGAEKTSGTNFGVGFVDGILAQYRPASDAASGLGSASVSGLNSGIDANSPSRLTTTSGEYFGQGFINGMANKESSIWQKAWNLAKQAIAGLKAGQKEGSPSKLTYQSGVYFVQGYINGIASEQKSLQKTVKNMVSGVVKELAKMSGFDFNTVAENASTKFADAMNDKTAYMLSKMQYQNEKKLAEFDKEIEKLQAQKSSKSDALQAQSEKKQAALQERYDKEEDKERKKALKKEIEAEKANVKKLIAESDKVYDKLIDTQEKYKDAYSTASSEMLSEFSEAMSAYQTKAQALIDDTINGITDRYNQRYDELLNKQNNLIDKLKGAGELFEISGAGIMTVNDLKEQTKAINDYTAKLQKIKKSVSSELFDQIASYDMVEGSAFMDRLLAMSKEDLEAYNKAYTEKMEAAQKAGEKIYKADFNQIAKDYKSEINTAFKGLDKELEALGTQTMKGFVTGLTKNTDYMSNEVKTFVKSMVDTFKKELKIKSPSRVMMAIGDYTGEGLVDGLKGTLNSIKKVANEMAQSVATPLDNMKTDLGDMKSGVRGQNSIAPQTNNVVNNYNLVQNNNSPKSLSALETYRARRQQIAMIKAMT